MKPGLELSWTGHFVLAITCYIIGGQPLMQVVLLAYLAIRASYIVTRPLRSRLERRRQ